MLLKSVLCALALLASVLALSAYAAVPPSSGSQPDLLQSLKAHVAFLCRPELKGRKTGTGGARAAARYVEKIYAAHGLLPWSEEKGYALPFGYGRNIVGVLPGNDPALKDEIVLVSAHYDHLGKIGGKIHPGASDNAAGVAALLETLGVLAAGEQRPKRSIAFAAFDSEEQMLFGSFAFSARPDVQQARIVAVVNVDIVGRTFMDVVTNTLFVAGTEGYPALREVVQDCGRASGIRVLPVGADLIGPRSDHVAFELRGVPCLFFTSGTFRDYHQPTDTPEKLDYAALESSARTVMATVRSMANATELPARGRNSPALAQLALREELQSVQTIIAEVNADRSGAGVTPEDAEALVRLQERAQALSEAGNYDREARMKLVSEATGILAPYFLAFGTDEKPRTPQQKQQLAAALRCVQCFYLMHKEDVLRGYRALVEQVLKDRPGPFRAMRQMNYRLYFIDDQDIKVARNADGTYALDALGHWLDLVAGSTSTKWFIKGFGASVSIGFDGIHCKGTREELEDLCLLHLRRRQTDPAAQQQIQKLLAAIEAPGAGLSWVKAINGRLRRGGFTDEHAWVASCVASTNATLALAALAAGDPHYPGFFAAACSVITNRQTRGDVRAAAIRATTTEKANPVLMLALCAVLDDNTPVVSDASYPLLNQDYPFADRPWVQAVRPFVQQQTAQDLRSRRTIGALAQEQLRKLSKRDRGASPAARVPAGTGTPSS